MNILIASASPEDARYFPAALGGHRVETIEGVPTGMHEDVEALAIVHGQPAAKEALDAMPSLRLIVTRSTGYDHIDLAEAARRCIVVCNVPEYGSTTVAEFTMGLILCLARRIPQAVAATRGGAFSVAGLMGTDLAGAALDVPEGEEALRDWTPDANMERNLALMNHPNVLVTPHLAYDSQEALARIRETTAEILRAFAEGRTLYAVPA